jgi:hypothetical protein
LLFKETRKRERQQKENIIKHCSFPKFRPLSNNNHFRQFKRNKMEKRKLSLSAQVKDP